MVEGRLLIVVIAVVVGVLVRNCHARDGTTSCNVPNIIRTNFKNSIEILIGANRTLSCEIHSDTPLKREPIWRKKISEKFSELPTNLNYSVENVSCSISTNKTCIISNLTLLNVVRGEYDGNYSLTAENDCGNATVYVYINIMLPQNCVYDYNKAPQPKISPPPVIQAMEGHSVTVMAQYEGNEDDPNLGVYWCVYKTLHDYYCYNTTEEDDNYIVKTDGCPTHNKTCCYFTVLLTIQSVTRDLTLQTIIVWLQNPGIFIPGNSSLVANVYPALDKRIPSLSNHCVELSEGQSTEFTCVYNASTNQSVTITTWKFNEELLKHNSSHCTMITQYGNDPVNFNRVLSRITLLNVKPNNTGTYTCQCVYNSKVIVNDEEGIVSEAANFCLKVKPYIKVKPGFPWLYIIIGVMGLVVVVLTSMAVVVLILVCCWKRQKNKKSDQNFDTPGAETVNENTRLLSGNDRDNRMVNVAADDPSINNRCERAEIPENGRERSPSRSHRGKEDKASHLPCDHRLEGDSSSAEQTENQDKLISGQDSCLSRAGLIPTHQRCNRQPGDMVTGATGGAAAGEILERPCGIGHANQPEPVTPKSLIQGVRDEINKAARTKKPELSGFSTEKPIESESEGPRTSHPAAVRPPVSESVMPRTSNLANNDVPSATIVSDYHDKVLDLIAPDFTANLNMVTLLPYLLQHHLVTRNEEHHLSILLHSPSEKAQLLLGYLKTKGDERLQRVLCCLNLAHDHIGHKEVADKLKQIMKDHNIRCADFCSDHCKYNC